MSDGSRVGAVVPVPRVEVSARETVPAWIGYGTPVFTVLAALGVGSIALLALGSNPLVAYERMFVGPLTDAFGRERVLLKAVPLVLTGLAVYLPLRAGLWNIGAEGQLYLGAVAGTWIGVNVSASPVVLLPLALLGGALLGGLWGAVPGYLRARRGVNEIIATLMLTFVGIELAGYLVRGPMQGETGNFPVSALLPPAATLPSLGSLPLVGSLLDPVVGSPHVGVLVVIGVVAAVRLLVTRTELGYEIVVTGSNPDAARGAGIDTGALYVLVLAVGGALAGLAGAIEIVGVQGRLRAGFSPGYGFTAIPIALLGRRGALRVGLASLFFALLFVGGQSVTLDVPAAIIDVIQALVILFLITAEFFKRYRLELRWRARTADAAGEVD